MKTRVRTALALLAFSSIGIVPMQAMAQANESGALSARIALLEGPSRLQTLIEGAKKEGELTIYHSNIEDIPILIAAFTKKYGIKVNSWRSGSEQITQRVMAESQARRFKADLVDNNVLGVEALQREGILQPANSPFSNDLIAQARPAHKGWVGTTVDIFVAGYNPQKIKASELPKTYKDLLDPKWKDKLVVEAEDYHWFATLKEQLGQEQGTQLFKDIVATNGMTVLKGHSKMAYFVVTGEVPLGLSLYHYKPMQMKASGQAIEVHIIPPSVAHLRGLGMLKNAPNPHAAMLFYDFLISEGQSIYASRFHYPTSTKVDNPLRNLKPVIVDPVRTLDSNVKWMKEYEEEMKPRAKR